MKQGWKRLSWGLAVLLSLALLAACGTGGGTNTPGNTGAGSDTTEEGEQEPVSIKMFAGLYNEVPDMTNDYWTAWQEMTNSKLNVEWVPAGELTTKLDLLLASGELPEVVAVPDFKRPTLLSAVKSGAFWDLTDFLGDFSDYPNLRDNVVEDAYKYRMVDGRIYSLPGSRSRVDNGIKIRKDWLDALDIPVPTTLDEYADALRQLVAGDPDGNERNDTLGLIAEGIDTSFAAGFGALQPQYDEDGGMIYTNMTPAYTEAVEWFRELYAEGLLPQEFSVMRMSQAEELFKTGRGASYARSIWWDHEYEEMIARSGQPDPVILNLTLEGPGGYAVALSIGGGGGYFISKQVPEEKVWRLLDYFEQTASKEVHELSYYGLEGIHHEVVDGQKVLTDQGSLEVNTSSKGVGVLNYAQWGKVISASGSKEYNDAKIAEVEHFDEVGQVNPFQYLISDTWVNVWSRYENEWETMKTQAIVGQITMDEYREYVDRFNQLPETKQAYQEFAEHYETFANLEDPANEGDEESGENGAE